MPGWQKMVNSPTAAALLVGLLWAALTAPLIAQRDPATPTPPDSPSTSPPSAANKAPRSADWDLRERLALQFVRSARQAAATNPLTVPAMDAAIIFVERAAELDPDNELVWRVGRRVGMLAEDDSLRRRAVRKLIELGIDDQTIVLMRLKDAINQYQTAERRRDMYARLLSEEKRQQLPGPVASELALDYALLLRLTGDREGFAEWLAQAVVLDPANAVAASTAAGYFIQNVEDPYGEAELLLNLVRANITDIEAQIALAQLLLEHGAYRGASRMYRLAAASARRAGSALPTELLGDVAIGQWAGGDPDGALNTIRERQRQRTNLERSQLARQNPDVDADQLMQHQAMLAPAAAAVRAALYHRLGVQWGDNERGADALSRAQRTYDFAIQQIDRRLEEVDTYLDSNATQSAPQDDWLEPDATTTSQDDFKSTQSTQPATKPDGESQTQSNTQPETQAQSRVDRARRQLISAKAQLLLEKAWLTVWLNGSPQNVRLALENVNALRPVTEDAQQRFDGWLALNRGEIDRAIPLLQPLAENDAAARLGLGMALLKDDQRRRAAENLLNVAREKTGTLMGVYAADVLSDVLGRSVPLTNRAKSLEELIESVPRTIDRFPSDPRLAVGLRVVPQELTVEAFEPVIVNVQVTNNAPFPLGIRSGGPIQPNIAMIVSAQIVGDHVPMDRRPIVIEIDRQLQLAPGERMNIPLNLDAYHVGREIERNLLQGAILHVRAVSNFQMTQTQDLQPGLLGVEVDAPRIRINGARVDDQWLSAAIDLVSEPDATRDVKYLAMLCHATAGGGSLDQRLVDQASDVIPQAYDKLNDVQRAWMLATVPSEVLPTPIARRARQDTAPLTRLSYLANKTYGVDDPALIAALNSDDPRLKQVAKWARQYVLQLEQRSAQQGR